MRLSPERESPPLAHQAHAARLICTAHCRSLLSSPIFIMQTPCQLNGMALHEPLWHIEAMKRSGMLSNPLP